MSTANLSLTLIGGSLFIVGVAVFLFGLYAYATDARVKNYTSDRGAWILIVGTVLIVTALVSDILQQ